MRPVLFEKSAHSNGDCSIGEQPDLSSEVTDFATQVHRVRTVDRLIRHGDTSPIWIKESTGEVWLLQTNPVPFTPFDAQTLQASEQQTTSLPLRWKKI
jgi:hypothetical protein